MRRSFSTLIGLCLAIFLPLALATHVNAQEKKAEKKADETRIDGRVQMINKDTSTITVRRDNVRHQILYNADTKFTFRNQPGSIDDVKEGRRVICLVKTDEKKQTVATRIDVRERR